MKSPVPSSPAERLARDPEAVIPLAERLCGEKVVAAEPSPGGGNNRVYRIETRRAVFAMKFYGLPESGRDRLRHEFDALRFLKRSGFGQCLPAAVAVDQDARCALYEWIDGVVPAEHNVADVVAAVDLLAELHAARNVEGASDLPPATEAVLALSDLQRQIEVRLSRLAGVLPTEPELAAFLRTELQPELDRRSSALRCWNVDAPLPMSGRTLSPSDFGFHNALRKGDGSLCFIDFEYFGWDDPVKVTADFLWHPGMQLSGAERVAFLDGVTHLYASDPKFSSRLAVCLPLYGIRWVLIILNEFLPNLRDRRAFSGRGEDWHTVKRGQMLKARMKLAALRSDDEGRGIS